MLGCTRRPMAKLAYLGHVLMENRHGLVVARTVTAADGHGELDAALSMLTRRPARRITLGADKAHCRELHRHVAATARHPAHRAIRHDGPSPECPRPPHHAACGVRDQSAKTQTGRRGLRLDEDGRLAPQTAAPGAPPRELVLRLHRRRVQLGADATAGGGPSLTSVVQGRAHRRPRARANRSRLAEHVR